MTRPTPDPIEPQRFVDLATKTMRPPASRSCMATIDGDEPRVRPVSPVRTNSFTVYIANLRAYHKTVEIEGQPPGELCYLEGGHDQVRITGIAEVITDPALLRAIWDENPLLRGYLGTIDNPEWIVYRVTPQRVRFMREWAVSSTRCRSVLLGNEGSDETDFDTGDDPPPGRAIRPYVRLSPHTSILSRSPP